jgi:hypothetical protein
MTEGAAINRGGALLPRFFVTIDAETAVIEEGVRVISDIREGVEARERIRIPLVWFVRFQRDFSDYVENDSAEAFADFPNRGFDGFAAARQLLVELRSRGDEIGWHYHAYSYVHRHDLDHATRLEILRTDLDSCARELQSRHRDFAISSFRFGWCFVPDYAIYEHLTRLGISRDASIDPRHREGDRVKTFSSTYLRPLVTRPARIKALSLFPCVQTLLLHDWNVVAHTFSWSRMNEREAAAKQNEFANDLVSIAARLKADGGSFSTYEAAESELIESPARA